MHEVLSAIVIVLFVCAIIGAALLSRVHRSGTGFLLGVFLGPVGLSIARLKRPRWQWDRAAKARALRVNVRNKLNVSGGATSTSVIIRYRLATPHRGAELRAGTA